MFLWVRVTKPLIFLDKCVQISALPPERSHCVQFFSKNREQLLICTRTSLLVLVAPEYFHLVFIPVIIAFVLVH